MSYTYCAGCGQCCFDGAHCQCQKTDIGRLRTVLISMGIECVTEHIETPSGDKISKSQLRMPISSHETLECHFDAEGKYIKTEVVF